MRDKGGRDKKAISTLLNHQVQLPSPFTDFILMASLDSQTAKDPENEPILSLLRQREMVLNLEKKRRRV